jgi:hypothetical protein
MPNYVLSPPPHGILISKGAVHIAVSRGYVDYVINDHRARDILQWMNRSCFIPDESFFTTMNINPHLGVPGSYLGKFASLFCIIETIKLNQLDLIIFFI